MLDLRIYRAAFVPVLVAVVVLMFSLDPAPTQLQGPVSTPAFEASAAARLARTITQLAPDRTPGSQGDEASAKFVRERFAAVQGGELAQQPFDTSVDGADVRTSNVVLTIPGASEQTLLVVAPRDTIAGDGATTSASATGALLTLAEALGNSRHHARSCSPRPRGRPTVRRGFASSSARSTHPAGSPRQSSSTTRASPSAGSRSSSPATPAPRPCPPVLLETADAIATTQFGEKAAPSGAWAALSRLAFPVGVGPGTALADEGVDGVTVSPAGELPPDPAAADGAGISTDNLFATGTTALNLLLTLDETDRSITGGPQNYVRLGSNVIPGWTFELLAITLLLPSLLAAIDVWVRDRRRNRRAARRSVPWTLERILIPLAALIVVYLLGLFGLIPDPGFPYDPGSLSPGAKAPVAFGLLALTVVGVAVLVRPMRTPLDAEPQTLGAAAGILACVSILGIWLINPYLALLATPAAHVWIPTARPQGPPRAPLIALGALLSLILVAAAFGKVASILGLGAAAPWQLLVLIVDGHVNPLMALAWCGLTRGADRLRRCRRRPPGRDPGDDFLAPPARARPFGLRRTRLARRGPV